jgi:hypothetical protein
LSSDIVGTNGEIERIIQSIDLRKAQLQKQRQSVLEANEAAEGIDLLSLTKQKASS